MVDETNSCLTKCVLGTRPISLIQKTLFAEPLSLVPSLLPVFLHGEEPGYEARTSYRQVLEQQNSKLEERVATDSQFLSCTINPPGQKKPAYLPIHVVSSSLKVGEYRDSTLELGHFLRCDWLEPAVLHGARRFTMGEQDIN